MITRFMTLTAAIALVAAPASADAAGYVVVVHPQQEGEALSRATLTDIFLKKAPNWGNGSAIWVVDQSLTSEVRARFCQEVMGLSVLAVREFWQHALTSCSSYERRRGRCPSPPMVKSSDADVLEFVASKPGAIGYLSADVPLDTVKVVKVLE